MALLALGACGFAQDNRVENADHAVEMGSKWVQPKSASDLLIWGHKEGIRVGLHPTRGPRGLIRIYAPYLGHKEDKMINFIALEPIVKGEDIRGFSELEQSSVDGKKGKLFISSNDADQVSFSKEQQFAPGLIEETEGVESLTFYVHSEPFDNGAQVYVRVRFYSDKPYEVELTSFTQSNSVPLEHLILTATMGNFARLRNLHLKGSTLSSLQIWPEYTDIHFTDHHVVSSEQMIKASNGGVYFIASPDEVDPVNVTYSKNTNEHWHYYGEKATQYWRVDGSEEAFQGLVNGRYTYWASKAPIPGGISYENFELKRPFKKGQVTVFGVSPMTPQAFINQIIE